MMMPKLSVQLEDAIVRKHDTIGVNRAMLKRVCVWECVDRLKRTMKKKRWKGINEEQINQVPSANEIS